MSISVKYDYYRGLDGSRTKLVQQVGDGSIIKRFDKTPFPSMPTDVVCPHFLELKWSYGCPFNCSWCYLKGTLRFLPTKAAPVIKNFDKIKLHLESFFNETVPNGYPKEVLNTGEISDSLVWERNGQPFSKFILDIFDTQHRHKVLFLTKSNWIQNLIRLNHNGSPIISFSMNSSFVSGRWEKKAPAIRKRIEAARELQKVGYPVRIRIDPMVPIKNWERHYKLLVDGIFSKITPERITLGSLRGLQSTINNCPDKTWVKYLSEKSNWGKKIDFEKRREMYSFIIKYLKENYHFHNVALCKETVEMWEQLRMNHKNIKCNCII